MNEVDEAAGEPADGMEQDGDAPAEPAEVWDLDV